MKKNMSISKKIYANDIKFIRKYLNLTQREFAQLTNVSIKTVQGWERGEKGIVGPIVPLIQLLFGSNKSFDLLTFPQKEMSLRMWYMYRNIVCSVIDIDERKRKVNVYNFIEDVLYKAFGKNIEPNFEDYEEFLESRCFPKTRDKMKLILKDLDLPFYDPLMIIEKTEGRMAEDNFWIRIER